MIVGLAPRHAKPASGLHAILPVGAPAAYLVGLWNSTYVQGLAATLPPGMLRSNDVADLGLPSLAGEQRDFVAQAAISLADLVVSMLSPTDRWPLLADVIKTDLSLPDVPLHAWTPPRGSAATSGSLRAVPWAELEPSGTLRRRITAVREEITVFGPAITASSGERSLLRIRVPAQVLPAIKALVSGAMAQGAALETLGEVAVPTSPEALQAAFGADLASLHASVQEYQALRVQIDDALDEVL